MSQRLVNLLETETSVLATRATFYEHYATQLAETQGAAELVGWQTRAAVATAFRFAAQYALLVDAARARRLLRRAADAYLGLGLPYGYLLLAASEPREVSQRMFSDLNSRSHGNEPYASERPLASAADGHPVQLSYRLLVMSGNVALAQELPGEREALHRQLTAHRTAPIGAQNLSVGDYLTFADLLTILTVDTSLGADVEPVADAVLVALTGIGTGYAEGIQRAQANTYLWRHQQSPVDIVDLDIVAMTRLASSALASHQIDLAQLTSREPTLATLPMYAAMELNEPGELELT
jgi:hypothetical protein